jgi:hypothetical protein
MGMFPLWEDTGTVLPAHGVYLGTDSVSGSPFDGVQVNISPNYFVHRAPNADIKIRLFTRGAWSLAWRQTVMGLFRNAQDRFFLQTYTSRIFNPRSEILLLPANVSATFAPWSFLRLHGTATLMPQVYFFPKKRGVHVWTGLSAMAEIIFLPGNSLFFHLGEVGFWEHEFAYLAASYRFNYAWFVARAGFVYRVYPEGLQRAPFVTLGAQW